MYAATQTLFGLVALGLAPLPPEAPPDPLARGYLGIVVEPGTMTVRDVEPSTPAARAGLRSGDTIARVGGLRPKVFEEVVQHVCGYRPGTYLEVEVRRGDDSVVMRVRLAARPERLGRPLTPAEMPPYPPPGE